MDPSDRCPCPHREALSCTICLGFTRSLGGMHSWSRHLLTRSRARRRGSGEILYSGCRTSSPRRHGESDYIWYIGHPNTVPALAIARPFTHATYQTSQNIFFLLDLTLAGGQTSFLLGRNMHTSFNDYTVGAPEFPRIWWTAVLSQRVAGLGGYS